jgi:hypothetical protein
MAGTIDELKANKINWKITFERTWQRNKELGDSGL